MARPFWSGFFLCYDGSLGCFRAISLYPLLYIYVQKKTVPAEADTAYIIEFRITPTCKDYDTRSGALS